MRCFKKTMFDSATAIITPRGSQTNNEGVYWKQNIMQQIAHRRQFPTPTKKTYLTSRPRLFLLEAKSILLTTIWPSKIMSTKLSFPIFSLIIYLRRQYKHSRYILMDSSFSFFVCPIFMKKKQQLRRCLLEDTFVRPTAYNEIAPIQRLFYEEVLVEQPAVTKGANALAQTRGWPAPASLSTSAGDGWASQPNMC